jgi:hypothetical protein
VAAELARSLDHVNVAKREKGEVLAAFAAYKGELVEGYTGQYGVAGAWIVAIAAIVLLSIFI